MGRKTMWTSLPTWLTATCRFGRFPCPFVDGSPLFASIPARHDGSAFERTIWGTGREIVRKAGATCTETCTSGVAGRLSPCCQAWHGGTRTCPVPSKKVWIYTPGFIARMISMLRILMDAGDTGRCSLGEDCQVPSPPLRQIWRGPPRS